jgi:hypothetical protein
LRGAADMPFYVAGEPVHRGSAMLAPIVGRDGRICGLHITWIDLNDPKGQARVVDPKTKTLLPAKKVWREQGRIVDAVHHCPRREAVRSGRSDGSGGLGASWARLQ